MKIFLTMRDTIQTSYYIVALAGIVWVALKAVPRWIVRETIQRKFVEDIATNHLPHIQHALYAIAEKLGLDLGDPPPIRYWRDKNNEH